MELDGTSKKVIRELCMDSRISVSRLASKIGCSRSTAASRIRLVEETAGLRYTVEPDMARLGLNFSYYISIKLRRELSEEEIAPLLSTSPFVQFAAVCRGDFDLLLFVAAMNHVEFMRWAYRFRSALSEEIVSWKASHLLFARFGFFPLNDETLARSLLPSPQKELLIELNRNSRQTFRELAKRLGTSVARVRYYYRDIVKSGYVKRFTAFIQKPTMPIHLVNFRYYTYQKEHEAASKEERALIKTEELYQVPNKNALVVETTGASDAIHWISARDVKSAYDDLKETEQKYHGYMRTESALVTKVIYGLWPLRSLDIEKVYDASSWD